jgi:pimeloyl-ACP methyl ester carboxylesterase
MTAKRLSITLLTLVLLATTAGAQNISIRGLGNKGRADEEKTKNIHGSVVDQNGKPIPGARVLILNTNESISRNLITDEAGKYAIHGLTPTVNYELRADFRGVVSEKKSIPAALDREDNLVNFQLNMTTGVPAAATSAAQPNSSANAEFQTFDLVRLKASYELPQGVPAPIPAVLFLHGYGENRAVWDDFRKQMLQRGWAVMSVDLRGHGESLTKNQRPMQASPEWRNNPREFPLDVGPALDYLKKQPRLNSSKIVIVGYDIGANLALVASGKFREVRTVVAVNPNPNESLSMAGSSQDFVPRSAMVVTETAAQSDALKPYVKAPFRSLIQPVSGGTTQVFQSKALADAIFQWLKESY